MKQFYRRLRFRLFPLLFYRMNLIKIAISGELGSGKSVLSKKLSEFYKAEIVSVGRIQRELAIKHGFSALEFNRYMESHPEIDEECDSMVKSYGNSEQSLILDSRLAWNFVPNAFKLHLLVDSKIAADRIFNDSKRVSEKYASIEEAERNLKNRKSSEYVRFLTQYSIDIDDFTNYDFIVDTGNSGPEMTFAHVIEGVKKWVDKSELHSLWMSPKSLFPTQGIREHSPQYTEQIMEVEGSDRGIQPWPVVIIRYQGEFYIVDGHKRVCRSLASGADFIPCKLLEPEKGDLIGTYRQTEKEYLLGNYARKNVYDWEELNSFRFSSYPVFDF